MNTDIDANSANRVRYSVYKRRPRRQRCLWRLFVKMLKVSDVLGSWCRADGVYIPKGENSLTLSFGQSLS